MPAEQKVKRTLRAILSADVKGYSLLMADDEIHTIETLKAYRQIMSEYIQQHSGRVVDSPGDNLLAEFGSAVDAVQCAVEVQKQLQRENARYVEEKRIQFRIGVNIGDVVQDGDRIYGSGVNVAARIEGIADPGGVSISRNAYDHIKDKLRLGYEYLGDHEVKNIKDPVRVYKVLLDSQDAGKLIGEKPKRAEKKWILPVIIVAAIIVTSLSWHLYQNIIRPEIEPASVEEMALPLPEKPSIAVLPFTNMSDDKEQEYFSDGMTDELIGDLAKIKDIFVISRNSVFTYKGKSKNIKEIAKELNVRYILEGSVQRSGNKVRIRAQLIDGETDHHLWSESYDGVLDDIFELQDKITGKIVSALAVKLSSDEQKRISSRGTDNHLAYEAFLKGREHYYKFTPDDFIKAVDYFEQAIKIDPNYSRAYAALGMTYNSAWDFGFKAFFKNFSIRGDTARLKAIHYLKLAMRNPTYEAYSFAAEVEHDLRHFKKMINYAEKAISITPNAANANLLLGRVFLWSSQPEKAIEFCNIAVKLDPNSIDTFAEATIIIGNAYFHLGHYEQAVEFIEKGLRVNPEMRKKYSHVLAASYANLNRNNEAKKALEDWLKFFPSGNYPSLQNIYGWRSYKNEEVFDRFAKGLVKAGFPGDPSDYVKLVEENKLSGEENIEKGQGHTMSGFTHWGAEEWWNMDKEGNINWKMEWMGKEYSDKGQYWKEGDMLCLQFENVLSGFTNCGFTYRNPGGNAETKNEYLSLSYLGLSYFSIVD